MIAVGLAVDDVDRSRENDEERRIALSLFEEDLARRERDGLGVFRQLLDLSRREAREQGRIVRIQEPGDRGGGVYMAHDRKCRSWLTRVPLRLVISTSSGTRNAIRIASTYSPPRR